jgi:AcrR family transcriptional regulator
MLDVVMSNNVVDDHNDVNGNLDRPSGASAAGRPYHHGNLRTALLEQAERTVRERGVADVSLRQLAREVGVSHGAPRRHFPDRQALLDALAEAGFGRLGAELRNAVDAAGEDFEERLRATAAAYIRFATRDAALLELMFAGKHGEQSGVLNEAANRAFSVMLELIEQGQAEGALEPGQPKRVGLRGGRVDAEQLDELVADAIAHFLRGSSSAA